MALSERYTSLSREIAAAGGRLIAVTKTHPVSLIQELYDLGLVEPVNVINDPALTAVRACMVQHAATLMRSDKRWSGYFSSFRLHNMEYFMDESLDDIQMLKPQS